MSLLRRLAAALAPPAELEPAGLPFGALYPTLAPELRIRSYAPPRSVPASLEPVVLAPANPSRRSLSIVNDGTGVLYIAEALTVSSASYTVALTAGQTFVSEGPDVYRGDVAGAWSTLSGSARITETA